MHSVHQLVRGEREERGIILCVRISDGSESRGENGKNMGKGHKQDGHFFLAFSLHELHDLGNDFVTRQSMVAPRFRNGNIGQKRHARRRGETIAFVEAPESAFSIRGTQKSAQRGARVHASKVK